MPAGEEFTLEPSDMLLTNQVAVVTGGGAGIGQGIALGMARFGADVVVLEIDPDRCEDTVARVEAMGRSCLAVETDVMDSDAVRRGIEQAASRFGRIDVLVSNASGLACPIRGIVRTAGGAQVMRRYMLLEREGIVEEWASTAVFLRSKMGAYITGVSISVDGGTAAASGWTRTCEGGWALTHNV